MGANELKETETPEVRKAHANCKFSASVTYRPGKLVMNVAKYNLLAARF